MFSTKSVPMFLFTTISNDDVQTATAICGVKAVVAAISSKTGLKLNVIREEMANIGAVLLRKNMLDPEQTAPWFMTNVAHKKQYAKSKAAGGNIFKFAKGLRIKGHQDRVNDLLSCKAVGLKVSTIARYTGLSEAAVSSWCWPTQTASTNTPEVTESAHTASVPAGFVSVGAVAKDYTQEQDAAKYIAGIADSEGLDLAKVIEELQLLVK